MHHSRIRNTKIVKPLPSSKKAKNEDAESKTGSVSSKMAIIEDARQQKKGATSKGDSHYITKKTVRKYSLVPAERLACQG